MNRISFKFKHLYFSGADYFANTPHDTPPQLLLICRVFVLYPNFFCYYASFANRPDEAGLVKIGRGQEPLLFEVGGCSVDFESRAEALCYDFLHSQHAVTCHNKVTREKG